MNTKKPDEKIYLEEKFTIIRLRGSRIFNEVDYKRIESWDEDGEKVLIFRAKQL